MSGTPSPKRAPASVSFGLETQSKTRAVEHAGSVCQSAGEQSAEDADEDPMVESFKLAQLGAGVVVYAGCLFLILQNARWSTIDRAGSSTTLTSIAAIYMAVILLQANQQNSSSTPTGFK